ncbi:MAG: AMP-dependent synthetase [Acidobacteria bacterium]|nr:AMP-dependent synthetase [Acidobacteriota bacterium]
MAETISNLLASVHPDDAAVLASGRRALTYADLHDQIEQVTVCLRGHGIGRGDRVAFALPNGPELATTFLAVASFTTAAPLNPASSRQEFEFTLRELGIKALLLPEGDARMLRDLAAFSGMAVLDVRVHPGTPAGRFELVSAQPGNRETHRAAEPGPNDIALVLQTSGTTARPKTVPLMQRHLASSAQHIRATLGLGPADRCLNVMPLFHIHGIAACMLASLSAGGSVFCAAGFNAFRFFAELTESEATWYSAVPTVHQTVLTRAARNAERIAASRLRFIRSSSSALPPSVLLELESVFGVPVVEAYGMTEAAHQMASNPLPPGTRRLGTVGLAAGSDVAIMDPQGNLLPRGEIGEIVVRGANIFSGYENRPEANAEAFVAGWFRTGDQGVIDDDGYIAITGRLKEIINRGGEKISPREIDEVLLEHAAVQQAVAFAIPHAVLGEEVGVAVVLKEDAHVTERELLAFVAGRLAAFKVPSTVRLVEELPRGATGKVQRLHMARQLGLV